MDVFFLSADKPIAKRYELDKKTGELIKHPYPFVYEVTSHPEHPKDLAELNTLVQAYSAKGACLLKGLCHRPLQSESRAGSTSSEDKTQWICLDLDGIQGYQDVDQFLEAIGCQNVSYILQWSSSHNVEANSGFRCHIFMELAREYHPQLLKYWLTGLNLTTPGLESQLELTKTQNSLSWPLDITTCQNDKLLYLAAPSFGPGLQDPMPKGRIQLVQKKHQKLQITNKIMTREALRELTDKKVAELREAAGLPKRKTTKYKFAGTVEYMQNPDSATITDIKAERGFVYFNLNGGDSWAYYHPEDNPAFIYNFKGEPAYRTEDLLPEYWASIAQRVADYSPDPRGMIYLAFRDFRTSTYWNGTFDTTNQKLDLAMAKSETQLRHFMKQHGQPLGEYIPDWHLVFDPHNQYSIDITTRQVNTFQPSEAMLQDPMPRVNHIPPVTMKLIDHVLGHEQTTIDHFINWMAVLVQTMAPTQTAWILQGTQGTGKGMLFHHVISPMLGAQNVTAKRMEEIESEFTGFMENKFVVFVDEIEQGTSLYHAKITAKLKNLIAEPFISIRKMYQPPFMAPNYANMIFASNAPDPVSVPPDDRRYNVAPYQTNKLQITTIEVDALAAEVDLFYAFLKAFPADIDKARKPLDNDARRTLINVSMTAFDVITQAVKNGDIQTLWDHLPSEKPKVDVISPNYMTYTKYRDLLIKIIETGETKLSRDDLFIIYNWCVGNIPQSPNKFAAMLKHHHIQLEPVWIKDRTVRGIDVNQWQITPEWKEAVLKEIKNGVV